MHIGAINPADAWLTAQMQDDGDITHIQSSDLATGHAIVAVNREAENQILLCPGANRGIDMAAACVVLDQSTEGDGPFCRMRRMAMNLFKRPRRAD